jgi:hypothetical protein
MPDEAIMMPSIISRRKSAPELTSPTVGILIASPSYFVAFYYWRNFHDNNPEAVGHQ